MRDSEKLHLEIESLQRRLADAEQAVRALSSGGVDVVVCEAGATPQLRSQERLRESERLLRAVFDGAMDAMLLENDRGNYVEANPAACEQFGLPRARILGRSIADFAEPPFDSAAAREELLRTGRIAGQFRVVRADGERRDLDFRATANILPGLHLSVLRDLSERQRADDKLRRSEARLLQAQKLDAVGRLAGGVAHDFNNLLSVILTFASLLIDETSPTEPARVELGHIITAAEKAAALTRQLLAFGRQQLLEPSVVDVNMVVTGLQKMLRPLIGEDIVLTILTAPDLRRIVVDAGQLEQVIVNLVVNARDAMPRGGNLTIETANVDLDATYASAHRAVAPGRYVVLALTDTGTGMDCATQERMFEPFFTTKAIGKGTGLGLASVYGIVEQSHGHIGVDSEPGHGTTIKVYFPSTDRDSSQPSVPPLSATTLHGTETILLVDDEEQVRLSILAILRPHGYTVLEAYNAGDAFLVCEQFTAPIHLLLTDVVMPRMSGPQLAERLAPLRPAMKVVYVSGNAENAVVHHGVLDDGIAFVQKPIMPNALLRKVRAVLDGPPKPPSRAPLA